MYTTCWTTAGEQDKLCRSTRKVQCRGILGR